MTPSPEAIAAYTVEQCVQALAELSLSWDFDRSLLDPEHFRPVWPHVDEIANTALYLEDRIREIQTTEQARHANASRWAHRPEPPPPAARKKSGKPAQKFRIGSVIYDDIHQATRVTGIKITTLRAYISRKPETYGYVK
jgi:hypothetical protein